MPPIESSRKADDHCFETALEKQDEWYSRKAGIQERRHLFFAIAAVAPGAAASVLRAVDSLLRPGEACQGHCKAAENMKRKYRLYPKNADVYAEASDDAPYRRLMQRVATAIAGEQQLFGGSTPKARRRRRPIRMGILTIQSVNSYMQSRFGAVFIGLGMTVRRRGRPPP